MSRVDHLKTSFYLPAIGGGLLIGGGFQIILHKLLGLSTLRSQSVGAGAFVATCLCSVVEARNHPTPDRPPILPPPQEPDKLADTPPQSPSNTPPPTEPPPVIPTSEPTAAPPSSTDLSPPTSSQLPPTDQLIDAFGSEHTLVKAWGQTNTEGLAIRIEGTLLHVRQGKLAITIDSNSDTCEWELLKGLLQLSTPAKDSVPDALSALADPSGWPHPVAMAWHKLDSVEKNGITLTHSNDGSLCLTKDEGLTTSDGNSASITQTLSPAALIGSKEQLIKRLRDALSKLDLTDSP